MRACVFVLLRAVLAEIWARDEHDDELDKHAGHVHLSDQARPEAAHLELGGHGSHARLVTAPLELGGPAVGKTPSSGFDVVYQHDLWGDGGLGGGSGPGSTLDATRTISALLLHVILTLGTNSVLDAPCGAMVWMPGVLKAADDLRAVPGLARMPGGTGGLHASEPKPPIQYTGIDIVESIIASSSISFKSQRNWRFVRADVSDPQLQLAPHDLVLCRDLFFHLSMDKISAALRTFHRSGSTWLIATHNAHAVGPNVDHASWNAGFAPTVRGEAVVLPAGYTGGLNEGGYRPVNLRLPPFNLPAPEWEWVEWRHPTASSWDKVLCMWRLDAILSACQSAESIVLRSSSTGIISTLLSIVQQVLSTANGHDYHEGNCYTDHTKTTALEELRPKQLNLVMAAQRYGAQGVLEIGFNSGFSSGLFLETAMAIHVVAIDLGEHSYTRPCAEHLNAAFPGRFRLELGDSKIAALRLPATPTFSMVHVDGAHDVITASHDLSNAHARLLPGALVMDDTDAPHLSRMVDFLLLSTQYVEVTHTFMRTVKYHHRILERQSVASSVIVPEVLASFATRPPTAAEGLQLKQLRQRAIVNPSSLSANQTFSVCRIDAA